MSSKNRKFEKHAESQSLAFQAEFAISAAEASGDAQPRTPTFTIDAYSGAAIRQGWSRVPMVVDLAGMQADDVLPILYAHDADPYGGGPLDGVMGQSTVVSNNGRSLSLSGEMLGEGPTYDRVMRLSRKGMKFQASIGADIQRSEFVEAGIKVTVNGQEFSGPLSVVRASSLREVSIVLMGADKNTATSIAATQEVSMADTANQTPDETKVSAEATAPVAVEAKKPEATEATKEPNMAEIKAELLKEIKAELLADVRASRPAAPAVHVVAKPSVSDENVITAALCMAGNMRNVEKDFDERTLEAAHKRSRSIGLQDVLVEAARANGYQGPARIRDNGTLGQVLRAAFATHQIANVLAATYGKFLLTGFTAVESVWDRISNIRRVDDFKTVTGVRVNGGFEFEEVGNDGELKSADASDEARTLKAKTYGRISSLTRQDIINDDLGALTVIPSRLGRGAALKFNKVFWAEFLLSNSTYYQAATPGAGNNLAIGSLEAAYTAYGLLNDPDGNPLSQSVQTLLVPKGLGIAARKLNASATMLVSALGSTSGKVLEPQENVLRGLLDPVESAYLPTAATASQSTWWLAAGPDALPAMEVCFLNGVRVPTVEQAEADFNVLGVSVRGFFDFGVAKAEKLACYRMAHS